MRFQMAGVMSRHCLMSRLTFLGTIASFRWRKARHRFEGVVRQLALSSEALPLAARGHCQCVL